MSETSTKSGNRTVLWVIAGLLAVIAATVIIWAAVASNAKPEKDCSQWKGYDYFYCEQTK
ncbi:hypothetical protein DOE76_13875 [Leifsonia sp. ku-ls]|nr:hypothetical protein DOE76_13875 [Leifsonia sp. ku-ls]